MYGHAWLYMVMYGNVWPCEVMFGNMWSWSCVFMYDLWLSMIMYGCKGLARSCTVLKLKSPTACFKCQLYILLEIWDVMMIILLVEGEPENIFLFYHLQTL